MKTSINLKNLESRAVKEWLALYDTIITDCDAVLWHDNTAIAQVPETVNRLKALGKNIYFVTNNGTKTRHDLWQKARQLNYHIEENHIIAPTYSIAEYLRPQLQPEDKVYVIGSAGLSQELDNWNIRNFGIGEDLTPDKWGKQLQNVKRATENQKVAAVVVGFDEHFSFLKMLKAATFLSCNPNCLFVATNADAVHRYPQFSIPGTGAILAALQTCVGTPQAVVMGKPNPLISEKLIKSGAIQPHRTLMVGDCAKNDVLFGKNCGFDTLLVGTGSYNWSHVVTMSRNKKTQLLPDYYIDSLGDLLTFLE